MGWDKAYRRGFENIGDPSRMVRLGLERLVSAALILDLGCGKNARNTVYAAFCGHHVHAVDSAGEMFDENNNLIFMKSLPRNMKARISFYHGQISSFEIAEGIYGGIIMTRILQYIPPGQLQELLGRAGNGLVDKGIMMINYAASGGIPGKSLDVRKYQHQIEDVRAMLEGAGMAITHQENGNSKVSSVWFPALKGDFQVEAYDMIAERHHPI